ncbi:MAG TPA: sugar ABC transporter permease [Erysipelothrix sp.]
MLAVSEHSTHKRNKLLRKLTPYIFILPWLIGFILFTLGPLLLSFWMSLHDWRINKEPVFIGLGNYISIFKSDGQFVKSIIITLKFALIFVPLNMMLALLLAVLLTHEVKGVKLFRTIFYIPSVISGVAVSIIWGWIFNAKYGVLNYILSLLGVEGPMWLIDPNWALLAIVIASAWGVGTMMLIFYTAIKNIPKQLYESAIVDGASPLRCFISITLPIITPTILFNLITSLITSLQQLTLVILLTKGGPLKSTYFYGLYVYENAFKHHKLGYASANAWIMFVVILLLTLIVFRSSHSWVHYESSPDKREMVV